MIPSWLFNVNMDGIMIEVMMKMRIMGDISEERITLRIFNLFYANNLILCAESEEHLRVMTEHFAEVFNRYECKYR